MTDDDLDLDLDLGPDEPARAPRKAQPQAPAAADATGPATAGVLTERRPGFLGRVGASVASPLSHLAVPAWTVRNFLIVLAGLIVLLVLGLNWDPVRIHLLGLPVEMPKALAFVLNIAFGALLMWLWLRPRGEGRGE